MLFMGEEWAASTPFLFFCDLTPSLAAEVRTGRARELAHFTGLSRMAFARTLMPDPAAASTFSASRLDWGETTGATHARTLEHYRRLLAVRRRDIIPLIPQITEATSIQGPSGAFSVEWHLQGNAGTLRLIANLADLPAPLVGRAAGRLLFSTHPEIRAMFANGELAPWSVLWLHEHPAGRG
jgi:1,4-alpha-glucan branching enzyme